MAASRFTFFALLALLAPFALAQTFTSCNPMEKTDCPADPALGTNTTFNWTNGASADSKIWNTTAGQVGWSTDSAHFTVAKEGDSPTIQSKFYIFFGIVTVMMKSAPGTGIVSSIVLESDDLDEVDWELIGGNNTHVQTNYFGKGNTTSYDRAAWFPVDNPQGRFVNYTTHWTQDKIDWHVDGQLVRTLNYSDALGGRNFPQTPMTVRLGIWSGGDPKKNSNGTVQWAGGETDFKQAPFTMSVQSLYVQDFGSGKEYTYSDKTGSFSSIKSTSGPSYAQQQIIEASKPHGIAAKWNSLSKVAKIGILAGGGAFIVALLAFILICCIKQRRAGRREHAALEAQYHKEAAERETWRRREFGFDS